ncbi:MAG: PQ-loop domain-containing transporter [Mariprofundus sp.]|nr:PQ-loop domain-containing transporter [Mariprofundus sp.]
MVDVWQMMGSLAAMAFTVAFLDQVRMTYKTRDVAGLSLLQWLIFGAASAIFVAYYAHLSQWLMVVVSILGTLCCMALVTMILKFKNSHN